MENKKLMEPMIQSIISDLELRGYGLGTIKCHQKAFNRLQRYCKSINATEYSEQIGNQFIEYVKCCNSMMSASTLRNYTDSVKRLNCVLSGVEWRRCSSIKEKDYSKSCYDSLVTEYENYLTRAGKLRRVVRKRMIVIADFLAYAELNGYSQISEFTADIVLTGFNRASYKTGFRQYVRAFFQYAYNRELTKANLKHLIPRVVPHYGVPSVYSPEEIEQLLASIDRTTAIGKRNYAIILIAARLGLRASDIANLKFESLKAESIKIIQVKTNQPLTTVLLDEIKEAIFDYVDHGRQQVSESCIFLNKGGFGTISPDTIGFLTRRAFAKSGINIGNRKMGPHSLRASLATALLTEGNDYPTVQKVLGQKNIQSTKFYAKSDIEQLRTHAIPVPPPSGNFAALLGRETCVQ